MSSLGTRVTANLSFGLNPSAKRLKRGSTVNDDSEEKENN